MKLAPGAHRPTVSTSAHARVQREDGKSTMKGRFYCSICSAAWCLPVVCFACWKFVRTYRQRDDVFSLTVSCGHVRSQRHRSRTIQIKSQIVTGESFFGPSLLGDHCPGCGERNLCLDFPRPYVGCCVLLVSAGCLPGVRVRYLNIRPERQCRGRRRMEELGCVWTT